MTKINKLFEALKGDGKWKGVSLKMGPESDAFKQYLRDTGVAFEPSQDGDYIHFEVLVKDKEQEDNVNDYLDSLVIDEARTLSKTELVKRLNVALRGFLGDELADDVDARIELDDSDENTKVWFLSELGYTKAMNAAEVLDRVLEQSGYGDSYFDAETTGRWVAYLWK